MNDFNFDIKFDFDSEEKSTEQKSVKVHRGGARHLTRRQAARLHLKTLRNAADVLSFSEIIQK